MLASWLRREIYRHPPTCRNVLPRPPTTPAIPRRPGPIANPHDGQTSHIPDSAAKMLRTAILRSAAVAARAAVRPIPAAAARRFAIAPAPRVASFVPKTVTWQPVRCYAASGGLDKVEVYERIKELLSGFDKVRLGLGFAGQSEGLCMDLGWWAGASRHTGVGLRTGHPVACPGPSGTLSAPRESWRKLTRCSTNRSTTTPT